MESSFRSLVLSFSISLWLFTIRCIIVSFNFVSLMVRVLSSRINGWNRCLRCFGVIFGSLFFIWN